MRDRRLAVRYAGALLAAAKREGTLAGVAESYAAVLEVCRAHPDLRRFLEGPQVAEQEQKLLLTSVFGPRLEPLLLRFFHLLVDKIRIEYLLDAGEQLALLYEAERGYRRAQVTTAVPLPGELESGLREQLERIAGAKIIMEKRVDPAVIGGASVTLGDQILDGTVRTQLERLRDRLRQAPLRGR